MSTLITHADQITPDWLTAILREKGHLPAGAVVAVNAEPARPGASLIVPLKVSYSAEAPASAPKRLIFKSSGEQLGGAGRREVEFYAATAGNPKNLPLLRCYAAACDEAGAFYLLMEDLSETHLSHPPSFLPPTQARAEQVVDAFAHLHAHFWDSSQLQIFGGLPTEAFIREQQAEVAENFSAFADFLGDRLSTDRRKVYEKALAGYWPIRTARVKQGQHFTLIHDDPHVGNFLYPRDPHRDALRLIDWKSWSVNPGPCDLAHMMCVFWFPERRAQLQHTLLKHYHARLSERGVQNYSWEMLWHDYRLAAIGYLFYPVWQWSEGMPDFIWWHNAERTMLAFQDLQCEEILEM